MAGEYGGKGLSLMESVVLNEEFARAEAPLRADFFGDTLVGPTILQWGTEEQKQPFIPGILDGTISWCQGFSEPDAGSDLASLKTRAVLDGDEWVINGQKVWTTQAQFADYIFLLARTDPDVEKHAGISYLLVPMSQDGDRGPAHRAARRDRRVQRGLLHRCPLPGGQRGRRGNNGWKVAMTTLGFERGSSATTGYRRFQRELDTIIASPRDGDRRPAGPPAAWPGPGPKVKIMQINGYRSLTDAMQRHPPRAPPWGRATRCSGPRSTRTDHGAGHRHPRPGRPDPHRLPDDTVDGGRAGGGPTIRSAICRPRSSSRGRRPSGAAGRDPAQHRRRAGAGPARRAQAGSGRLKGGRRAGRAIRLCRDGVPPWCGPTGIAHDPSVGTFRGDSGGRGRASASICAVTISDMGPPPTSRAAAGENRQKRWTFLLLLFFPFVYAGVSQLLGQDVDFDLQNYHYFDSYWVLVNHMRDVTPAQLQTYLSPLLDVPFYFATQHFPPRLTGSLLAAIQGTAFPLLYLINRHFTARRLVALALAGLGMFTAGALGKWAPSSETLS